MGEGKTWGVVVITGVGEGVAIIGGVGGGGLWAGFAQPKIASVINRLTSMKIK